VHGSSRECEQIGFHDKWDKIFSSSIYLHDDDDDACCASAASGLDETTPSLLDCLRTKRWGRVNYFTPDEYEPAW
jgi:hypothetical protein